ncbi:MAG: hypothetical protein H7258_07650 [Ferruginibacter sp.]|nr:hypothetical protein [Ferruginibacter sp.]
MRILSAINISFVQHEGNYFMTGIPLLISAIVISVIFFLRRKKRFFIFRQKHIEADAIVLNIELTGVRTRAGLQAIIQLQVQPGRGKSFVIDAREMLSLAAYTKVHPGNIIRVKYNVANSRELTILKDSLNSE